MFRTSSGRPNPESNCYSTTLVPSLNDQSCCSSATGRTKEAEWRENHCQGGSRIAVVAEWRYSGRHCDRSMDAIGRPKEAPWWYKEGRSVAQIDTQGFTTVRIFYGATLGRPLCIHSYLQPRRCVCRPPASFERPVSDRPPRRPLCDCFESAQNFTATMASMAMSERPVYHPWTTKATVRPPFCLQWRPSQFWGRTREAQRSQPLCKGGINIVYQFERCFCLPCTTTLPTLADQLSDHMATTVPPFGDHGNPWATLSMVLPPLSLLCTTCCTTTAVLVV